MFRMARVLRSPLNTLMVVALLLGSLWVLAATRHAGPSVEWPRLVSAPATEHSASRESRVLEGLATDAAKAQPPSAVPPERWAAIQETIRRDMYSISASESGYLAENPAQRLNLAFDSDGLTVGPASRMKAPGALEQGPSFDEASAEGEPKWTWGLALAGYGYAGDIRPVSAGRVSTHDNRLTYSRGEGSAPLLEEWYVNESRGLEQGFTVFQAPDAGATGRNGQWLALDLRLHGNLVPSTVDRQGPDAARSIDFLSEGGGVVLRYGDLHVEDATGRSLPSRLAIVSQTGLPGQAIRILVDDADAIYPLVVDPLVTGQVKKLTASDAAANDFFGGLVAIDGDTVVVGAYGKSSNQGAAYVFVRNQGGSDNWGQVKKLTPSDGAANDSFGSSVAIDGDTIVVGAYHKNSFQGAAYVFARNQGGADNWGQVKKVTPSDGVANDYFGSSVSIDGDTIVVGAYGKSSLMGPNMGAAYVFARNQGGADNWGEVKKLTASDATANDLFGGSMSIDGDTIVVGANGKSSNQGAAYVFVRNQGGSDNWGQVKKLTPSDGAANDLFGSSVSIDVDTVVVGASNKSSGQGAAYVFARNQGGADNWGQMKNLTASDATANDYFGGSVAIDGNTVVVSAFRKDSSRGVAYAFARNQGGADNWGEAQKLTASDAAVNDYFGVSVFIDGDTIVAGAHGISSNQGAAYTFVRQGDTWQQISQPSASDGTANDLFGSSVAIDGDTIVIGAYFKATRQGAAYVFARNQEGTDNWGQVKKLTASDGVAYDEFGASVAIDGDIIVVGARSNSSYQGAAYVFARNNGGADSWGQVKKLIASDGAGGDYFGYSVAISGDTIMAGSVNGSGGQGAAYIFVRNQGGADNWGQLKRLTATDGAGNDYFGWSVDIDGDTIVVGAYYKSGSYTQQGAAYVYARNQGGADNWGQVKKLTASDADTNDRFGASVAIDGDTIVVGAYFNASYHGAAYIFARNQGGGGDSWGQAKKITGSDGAGGDRFGASVAIGGDTIVVGAYGNQGAAYAFARNQGGVDNWGQAQKLTDAAYDYFGSSVAIDWDTIVVGAYGKSSLQGGAYVYLPTASTTTTLAVSPNPTVYGQAVTYTATVTSTLGIPTGTVTFTVDSTAVTTATLSSGTGTFGTSSLTVGSHSVSASYGGDTTFNSSTSLTLTQVVTKANTTSALASVPNPSIYGQSVTFTATVTSTGGTPSGVVTFTIDSSIVATATLSSGSATYSTSALAAGSHAVDVAYSGDANFNSSSGSLTGGQTVNKADTTTTITAVSPNPSVTGGSTTVTFTVSAVSPGSGTPTGSVTVSGGGSSCDATLPATSCALTFGSSGTYTITATYTGDANFNGGSSTGTSETVLPAVYQVYLPIVLRQ